MFEQYNKFSFVNVSVYFDVALSIRQSTFVDN